MGGGPADSDSVTNQLKVGDAVKVHGLVKMKDLNNLRGEIVTKYPGGRFGVDLGAVGGKSIKASNLTLLPCTVFEIEKGRFDLDVGALVHVKGRRNIGWIEVVEMTMCQVQFANMSNERIPEGLLDLFVKEVIEHPGEPLLSVGDEKSLLHLIRTTKLGDSHICHVTARKCFEISFNNAPENFAARMVHNDLKDPPGAKVMTKEHELQLMLSLGEAAAPFNKWSHFGSQIYKQIPFKRLDKDKRHVIWVHLDPVEHHVLFERLAGNRGWRFYQSFVFNDRSVQDHYAVFYMDVLPPVTKFGKSGYSLLQWVSADPNGLLVDPNSEITHPHKRWGQGKIISFKEVKVIMELCKRLEDSMQAIVNSILPQLGCDPIPPQGAPMHKISAWVKQVNSKIFLQTQMFLHHIRDVGNIECSINRLSQGLTIEYPGNNPALRDFNFTVPAKLIEEFVPVYAELTGELPESKVYLKMLNFCNYTHTRHDHDKCRSGFRWGITESSDNVSKTK